MTMMMKNGFFGSEVVVWIGGGIRKLWLCWIGGKDYSCLVAIRRKTWSCGPMDFCTLPTTMRDHHRIFFH
jgi:hypothetical protein